MTIDPPIQNNVLHARFKGKNKQWQTKTVMDK